MPKSPYVYKVDDGGMSYKNIWLSKFSVKIKHICIIFQKAGSVPLSDKKWQKKIKANTLILLLLQIISTVHPNELCPFAP